MNEEMVPEGETATITILGRRFERRHLVWSGFTIVILVMLVGAGVWFYAAASEARNLASVPTELKEARYVQAQIKNKESKISGLHLVSATSQEDALRAFFPHSSTRGELSGISATKNWGMIVAAVKPISAVDVEKPQAWTTVMVIPSQNKEVTIGSGFSPFFLGNSHVARFTEQGIMLHYLGGGDDVLLVPHIFTHATIQTSHTSDGSLVAWREAGTTDVYVYRLNTVRTESVAHVQGVVGNFTLTHDALYDVSWGPKGTTITKFDLADDAVGKVIHTFPASFGITALSI